MTRNAPSRSEAPGRHRIEATGVGVHGVGGRVRKPPFPTSLLIDLPNWLGDLVMSFPATSRLVRANRRGRTVLHVRPSARRLVEHVFPDAEVVASPHKQAPLRTIWTGFRARFDHAVTLRNATRAKVLIRLLSRWSAGTCTQGGRVLLSWCARVDRHRHQVHDADSMLERLGLAGCDPLWKVALPGELVEQGAAALDASGADLSGVLVGLAPGVAMGGAAKQWSPEHFGRLADLACNAGMTPVVVVGPGEERLAESVVGSSGRRLPVVGTRLDAAGLAGVLAHLAAVVGNDSGPAHLAAVLEVPGLVLFGPTDQLRTAPLFSELEVVSRRLECAPCGELVCPHGHQACLRDIAPEAIARRLTRIAARRRHERTLAIAK